MNLFALRKQLDRLLHPVVNALARLPIHANAWTLLGALIGLVGGVVFFYGQWWLGLGLLIVRGLVDHVDGFKARNFNQRSTFGASWMTWGGWASVGRCLNGVRLPAHPDRVWSGSVRSRTHYCLDLVKSQQDTWREKARSHLVDVVNVRSMSSSSIGCGVLFTALLDDPRPLLAGYWRRDHTTCRCSARPFAWKRYRHVDPGLVDLSRAASRRCDRRRGGLVAPQWREYPAQTSRPRLA
jgi:hypothetical protein